MKNVVYDISTVSPPPPDGEKRLVFVLGSDGKTLVNVAAEVALCEGNVLGLGGAYRIAVLKLDPVALEEIGREYLKQKGIV